MLPTRRSTRSPFLVLTALAAAAAVLGPAFLPAPGAAPRQSGAEVAAGTAVGEAGQARGWAEAGARTPLAASALLPLLISTPAIADTGDFGEIPGALVAYGHYLSLVISTGCLTVERLTVKPGMTEEEESRFAAADAVYGVSGLLVVVTGYLRVTQYGKGWDFYQHEPIFWLKLTLLAITGAASFFITAIVVKRALARKDAGAAGLAPMSEKLAARMTSIINAELLAICSIPLTASLMARGVGYAEWLPWQAGAAPALLALGGLGFKYIKEALDWKEDEPGLSR